MIFTVIPFLALIGLVILDVLSSARERHTSWN